MKRSKTEPDASASDQGLLAFLERDDYRPMPQRELLHRLNVGPADRPAMRRIIRRLLRSGRIARIRGGRLVAVPAGAVFQGKLRRHPEGHGVIEPEEGGESVFVSARHAASARDGASVLVRPTGRRRDGRLHGNIIKVLDAAVRIRLGLFVRRGRMTYVQPFDPEAGEVLHVPASARGAAEHLDVVRWGAVASGSRRWAEEAEVLEVLGGFEEPATDTLVVAARHHLALEFPESVLRAAQDLPGTLSADEGGQRERFDDPPPVTIDGETARDFDDAIAVRPMARGFRLFVHIADVARFVRPGGAIDEEARLRGTSVYFPDRVLPMLPERLSNDLCSLRPGEDRLVQTAVIDFTPRGKVRGVRLADGVIRSAARLTYTQVAQVIDGTEQVEGVPANVVPMLRAADRLRSVLEQRRHERGSIDFDLPEPQILLDVEGVMTGIVIEPRNRAHRMIEEFMIAANEAVAGELERHGRPCMYRIHEPPDPAKIDALASFASRLGLQLLPGEGPIEPRDVQRLLDAVAERPSGAVVTQVALRSMSRARYTPDNEGHFGLASPIYCHFTSPIRRYPDLVVHRQLRALRQERPSPDSDPELRELGQHCSETERRAETAERELLARKKLAFIAAHVGESFDGVVTGVAAFGVFVQLVENLVEGLLRVEWLGDEWFVYDEAHFELVGERTGRKLRLGDRLRVRVDRVDRILQRVDFSLEGGSVREEGGRRRSGAPRAASRRRGGRRRSDGDRDR